MLDLDAKEPVGAVIWSLGVDVRAKILFEPDGSLSRNGWIRRGWSIVALMSLAVTFVAVVLTGLVSHCRSFPRWATVLTGVAWAVALYLSYDWLLWTGARWRLPRDLTRFQQVGRELATQWPALPDGKTSGRVAVPGLREVFARTNERPRLFVYDDFRQLPRREGFGLAIEREDDPHIIRIVLTSGYSLEYHVTGSAPKAYPTGEESKNVPKRVARVDENWYLVEYESVWPTAQSNDERSKKVGRARRSDR
jgi:hypothetical protein